MLKDYIKIKIYFNVANIEDEFKIANGDQKYDQVDTDPALDNDIAEAIALVGSTYPVEGTVEHGEISP